MCSGIRFRLIVHYKCNLLEAIYTTVRYLGFFKYEHTSRNEENVHLCINPKYWDRHA